MSKQGGYVALINSMYSSLSSVCSVKASGLFSLNGATAVFEMKLSDSSVTVFFKLTI